MCTDEPAVDKLSEWQRRVGVGERQPRDGQPPQLTRTTSVVADDGLLRGHEVGSRTEHRSGRVDSKVTAATMHVNPNVTPLLRRKAFK
jgi:hypothetical protein